MIGHHLRRRRQGSARYPRQNNALDLGGLELAVLMVA
jgi:hypothetical protein